MVVRGAKYWSSKTVLKYGTLWKSNWRKTSGCYTERAAVQFSSGLVYAKKGQEKPNVEGGLEGNIRQQWEMFR